MNFMVIIWHGQLYNIIQYRFKFDVCDTFERKKIILEYSIFRFTFTKGKRIDVVIGKE